MPTHDHRDMADLAVSDLEVAPPAAVRQAASDFAAALAETPQFRAFEQAAEGLRHDEAAQHAIAAYQDKQAALRVILMLNAVSAEDQAELEHLRETFLSNPSVVAYLQAQGDLTAICQAAADLLSQHTGLSYAAACRSGCCG